MRIQVVFEEFRFGQYLRRPASWFSAYEFRSSASSADVTFPESCVVLDSGFSFSHITPFIAGQPISYAVSRDIIRFSKSYEYLFN